MTDLEEALANLHVGGKNERLLVGHTIEEAERSRYDVHLPIANQNVAVAAETF
jgi:hypothetical protein